MNAEQLEFAISQYLDGTLSSREIAALEQLLAENAEARQLLEEHRRLQDFVRTALPLRQLKWDKLAGAISSAMADAKIAESSAPSEEAAIPEELEFLASQYLDGALPLPERVAFEKRLRSDPLAQQALEEQRALGGLLKAG